MNENEKKLVQNVNENEFTQKQAKVFSE